LGDKGQYDAAVIPLRRAAELEPNSYDAQFNLGFNLLKLGQYTGAEPSLRKALELRSDSFQANSTLAVLFINQDLPKEAIERLHAAHGIRPEDANILVLLGQQFLRIDKPQEAIQALGKAIKLMPDKPEIRYLLIEAYDQEQDYRNALTTAQEAKRSFPADARSCFEVGFELANIGRNQEARPYADKAIQIDPSFVPAYNLLGYVELRSGEYESALKAFQKAGSLAPQDVDSSVGIAKSLVQLNRYREALAGLQEAIKIHPESADLYFVLTQVYVRLGDKKEAAEANAIFQRLHAEGSLKR
jgi:tetratricopeptide (TPR) repeat protein